MRGWSKLYVIFKSLTSLKMDTNNVSYLTIDLILVNSKTDKDSHLRGAANSCRDKLRKQISLLWQLPPHRGRIAPTTRVCIISTLMSSWPNMLYRYSRTSSLEAQKALVLGSKRAKVLKERLPPVSSMRLSYLLCQGREDLTQRELRRTQRT